MTTTATRSFETGPPSAAPILHPGPVLVASDDRPSAAPAVRASREIAQRLGREISVLTVGEDATEGRPGDPAMAIAAVARRLDAAIIVTGLRHHVLISRLFTADLPASVAHLADRPLLAVAPCWKDLPDRIMIAVDLGEASEHVVATVAALFPEANAVHLVHVMPRSGNVAIGVANWEGVYKRQLAAQYARLRDRLPRSTLVTPMTLHGEPAEELRAFAAHVAPDLFVEGVHGHGLLHRLAVRDLPVQALRTATTSVLLVPG